MSRIQRIAPESANGKAKELLSAVKAKLGLVPNITRAMANSPAALEGYLGLNSALGANVALSIFTNCFNHVAETDIDFPAAAPLDVAAACSADGCGCAH
jgi:hypothetical protein